MVSRTRGWSGESAQSQQRSVGSAEGQSLVESEWDDACLSRDVKCMSCLYRDCRVYTRAYYWPLGSAKGLEPQLTEALQML